MNDTTKGASAQVELKPCPNPWCEKSAPELVKRFRFGGYTIECQSCDIDCGTSDEPAVAIERWNTRA